MSNTTKKKNFKKGHKMTKLEIFKSAIKTVAERGNKTPREITILLKAKDATTWDLVTSREDFIKLELRYS